MRLVVSCLTALLLLSTGCASLQRGAGEPDYASKAEENIRLGDEAMENRDYQRAEKYYEFVKTKFPYLEASKEAELKLGDVAFDEEQYPEAREKYESFIQLHPTHPGWTTPPTAPPSRT